MFESCVFGTKQQKFHWDDMSTNFQALEKEQTSVRIKDDKYTTHKNYSWVRTTHTKIVRGPDHR